MIILATKPGVTSILEIIVLWKVDVLHGFCMLSFTIVEWQSGTRQRDKRLVFLAFKGTKGQGGHLRPPINVKRSSLILQSKFCHAFNLYR